MLKPWDIIGDIHGQLGKLQSLLKEMGYRKSHGAWRHPERRLLFLGDYIDRGPDIPGVLGEVRAMVDEGEAVALMGNHELNALHYHTSGHDGKPIRAHTDAKRRQHAATLEQFSGRGDEWGGWLEWFWKLPLSFESEDFRAIHACWSERHLSTVRGRNFCDLDFLVSSGDKEDSAGMAVEILLKGPEIGLPPGILFRDKDGHERNSMRVRWWDLPKGKARFADLAMPPGTDAPEGWIGADEKDSIPDYPPHEKPVFVGHYWLPYGGEVSPLAGNVMCLDYSAGKGGPLVGCRWEGTLGSSRFFFSE